MGFVLKGRFGMGEDKDLHIVEPNKEVALVVDDVETNRLLLKELIGTSFHVEEAADGQEALDILKREYERIAIVILDVVMPVMSGDELLVIMRSTPELEDIPVIMVTSASEAEVKSLELGADDFITKPLDSRITLQRIKNVTARRALEKMRLENIRIREVERTNELLAERVMYDTLTGIYNRNAFCVVTEQRLTQVDDEHYYMLCLDVDRFKTINDLYGREAGDMVICKIADSMQEQVGSLGTFGRMEADRFACCVPARLLTDDVLDAYTYMRAKYDDFDFKVDLSLGIYSIENGSSMSVAQMCDRAYLAVQSIKGKYYERYAYFDESMRDALIKEQRIIDEMENALNEGQFVIYLQPQYNHVTGKLVGAEALARWHSPVLGDVSPSVFIPIFEKNGFITRLDECIWEQTCRLLRAELDCGIKPVPLSINISRIDIYNPNMLSTLLGLLERYDLPVSLLHLEITESAYVERSEQLLLVVNELRSHGFYIEMDDFGSGYSSLNTLKNVPFDLLKLDMMFLYGADESHRGGRILISVIRMAKWLEIPVIAEGVETTAQADFLKSVGCNIIQGFLYAKPMPADDYDVLLANAGIAPKHPSAHNAEHVNVDDFWGADSRFSYIFENFMGPTVIFEKKGSSLEPLRLNEEMYTTFGIDHELDNPFTQNVLNLMTNSEAEHFLDIISGAIASGAVTSCNVVWFHPRRPQVPINTHLHFQLIKGVPGRYTFMANVTKLDGAFKANEEATSLMTSDGPSKKSEWQNERYRLLNAESDLLTFDYDLASDMFTFAIQGDDDRLVEYSNRNMLDPESLSQYVDATSLDAVCREVSRAFESPRSDYLDFKANLLGRGNRWCRVRYVSVAGDDGRVCRVVGRIVDIDNQAKERELLLRRTEIDMLTGILNRSTAETLIAQRLDHKPPRTMDMMMVIDIDGFKDINDQHGHLKGDEILRRVAQCIESHFRGNDIVARFGGDEFIVYASDIKSPAAACTRANDMLVDFRRIVIEGAVHVSCSIGIALLKDEVSSVEGLFAKADEALYHAKQAGRDSYYLYGSDKDDQAEIASDTEPTG